MRLPHENVESLRLIAIWAVIGAVMTATTGLWLRNTLRSPDGVLDWAMLIHASLPLLLWFAVGVAMLCACTYALIDKARHYLHLDVATPVHPGATLRAHLASSRPFASGRGRALEIEFSCRELRGRDVTVLWRTKQEIPLAPQQKECDFGFEVPEEPRTGAYWLLSVDVPARKALYHWRVPVEPPA